MTRHLNQTGLLPQDVMDNHAIGIVGTGAIGSFCAMALTKMGFKNVVTWDPDKIEEHNIANQMFPVDSVGKRKALATREMVKQFSGEEVTCLATPAKGNKSLGYLQQSFPGKRYVLLLCVDSLDVRKEIAADLRGTWGLTVVDARMGAKTYRVLAFKPDYGRDLDNYLATLVPDAQAVQERCGQKSIIYTVLGVSAEVCSFVHQIVMPRVNNHYPNPVVFDYGTGIRIQRPLVSEVVRLDDEPVAF